MICLMGMCLIWVSLHAQDTQEKLGQLVDRWIQPQVDSREWVGASIGFSLKGRYHVFDFGAKALSDSTLPDIHTLYEIGSLSKTFTATMLAQMVVNQKARLSDPAGNYLPDSVVFPTNITLNHLASHISGLPRMPGNFFFYQKSADNPYQYYTPDALYAFLNQAKFINGPGEKYGYSNLGYGILGHILGRLSGGNYETMMKDSIFEVLGMETTCITLSEALSANLAQAHSEGKEVPYWDWTDVFQGTGGIRSCVHDLLIYLNAQMGIEPTRLHTAMQMTHQSVFQIDKRLSVGLGWHLMNESENTLVWHNGGTGGSQSFMAFDKDKKRGMVLLVNTQSSKADATQIGFKMMKELLEL